MASKWNPSGSDPSFTGQPLPQKRENETVHHIVIPVMGLTGVGKSTFINAVLGPNAKQMTVGHEIESCTVDVAIAEIDTSQFPHFPGLRGRHLLLVDTPGFDSTDADDSEVLERISKWLEDSYHTQLVLGGIIYLHDISTARFTGSAKKTLVMLKQLCGTGSLNKVVLGTTKSSRLVPVEVAKRLARLKDVHWKDMIDKGAQTIQFDGGQDSALNLVNALMVPFAGENTLLATRCEPELASMVSETKAETKLCDVLQQGLEAKRRH